MRYLNLFEDFEYDSYFDSIIPDSEVDMIQTRDDLLNFFKRHSNNLEEFAIALIKARRLMVPGGKLEWVVDHDPDFINSLTDIINRLPGGLKGLEKQLEDFGLGSSKKYKSGYNKPNYKSFETPDGEIEDEILKNMSQKDIMKLIDDALDKRDFDRVSKLSKYLESKNIFYPRHLILFENFK